MKTVKMLINIGTSDKHLLDLPEAYTDGQVVELEDHVADILIRRQWAKEYGTAARQEEDTRMAQENEAAIQRAMPAARQKLAEEEALAEATKRLKESRKHSASGKDAGGESEIPPSQNDLATAAEAGQKVDKFAEERAKNKPPTK